MIQNDMESFVSGIKQLNGVLVVVMPDCLLYSAWQRTGQTWDTESAGAYLGQLVLSNVQGLQAIESWSRVSQITLELDEGLIVIRQLKEPFTIAYVFDAGTAIGWARLQIQRTAPAIEASLDAEAVAVDDYSKEEAVVPPPPARPAPKATPVKQAPAPRPAARPIAKPTPAPAPAPTPVSAPAPAAAKPVPVKAPIAAPKPAPAKPAAPAPTVAKLASEPIMQPTGTGPNFGSPRLAEDAKSDQELPKGTRLIKYLDAHAPDTHAALLRVSLQTGLPLTLLRMPDSLSDDEFAQVEESVRRILGVDQLNF